MLVCPHCYFENPNNHRFCQKCGLSLTDQACTQCQFPVSFTAENCPQCGAQTGIRWRVVMATPTAEMSILWQNETEYLDAGARYRLLIDDHGQPFTALGKQGDYYFFQGTVIDGQPLQKSVLEVFLNPETELEQYPTDEDPTEEEEHLWHQIGIPKLALPYFQLKQLVPVLPPIHDAWQEADKEVILLSDRSHWQSLSELISEEPLPILQIIYWIKQMLSLWQALSPYHYSQSLLVAENLRGDEDQQFGLGQLYPDSAETPPSLKDLGEIWQKWLENPIQCQLNPLEDLLNQVISGKIESTDELQNQLQALAESQQLADDLPGEALDIDDLPEVLREQLAMAESSVALVDIEDDFEEVTSGPQIPLTYLEGGDEQPTAVLPMQVLSVSDAALTDTGRQRRHNEDFFGLATQISLKQTNQGRKVQGKGLYIVCDGMGGHASGEVASALAVETLLDYFQTHWQGELPDAEIIKEGIFKANQTLYDINQENSTSGSGRMGTTLVMMLVQNTEAAIAHVGDSRIYRINRKWGLEQLTVDHEVGQRAIQNGVEPEIAYSRPDAYQLTQALGPHNNHFIQPEVRYIHLQEDSLFLLCSDGLSDNQLIENHWEGHLQPLISASQSLETGLQKLIDLGNQKNGHDNITAVLVRIKVRPELDDQDW